MLKKGRKMYSAKNYWVWTSQPGNQVIIDTASSTV